MKKNNDTLTLEQKITQLEEMVAWFDSDEFVLEQATEHYTAARALAKDIEQTIAEFTHTIERVDETTSYS